MGRRHNGPLWLHFVRLLGAPRAAFFLFPAAGIDVLVKNQFETAEEDVENDF